MWDEKPHLDPFLGKQLLKALDGVRRAPVHDENGLVVERPQTRAQACSRFFHFWDEYLTHPSVKDVPVDEACVGREDPDVSERVASFEDVRVDCFCAGDDCWGQRFPVERDAGDQCASP